MKDDDLMPWGKYKGDKMANIPPDYLLWLLDNDKCSGEVRKYIMDCKDFLVKEIEMNKKRRK